jgi:RimJ/RimL family protein N-acetyltransferase
MAVVTNIASIKANEKVGFKIEAELQKHVYKNGKYHNVAVLALLAEDYYKNIENDSL